MKLQIVVIKKKNIYYAIAIIILMITFSFFILSEEETISTFSIGSESKMMQSDLTGDGTKDILYINNEKDNYYIQINSESNSHYLEASKKLSTVGNYYDYWPLRLTLMDISEDISPEIFTQACTNNSAIQHAFFWDGEKFNDIFCNTNNILGFASTKGSTTPKILSGNFKDGDITLTSYIFIKNAITPFAYNYPENYMGKDTIVGFLNLISGFPLAELNISKVLFSPNLNGNHISLLTDLSNRKVYYTFQDATFKESNWDDNGNATEVLWTLNFNGANTNNLKEVNNYTMELLLKDTPTDGEGSNFKINAITLK